MPQTGEISAASRIAALLVKVLCMFKRRGHSEKHKTLPVTLVVHAGAGNILKQKMTYEEEEQLRAGISQAIDCGYAILRNDGLAIDAVEASVRSLENNPLFNAGKGAVFNRDGINQLEASIMDGNLGAAGAATLLTTVKNPITLARKVMESNFHVFLCGPGAESYAKEQGLDIVDPSYFWTRHRWEQHERGYIHNKPLTTGNSGSSSLTTVASATLADSKHKGYLDLPMGTVGAVAIDANGYMAAATSTGGMSNKWDGRIGDSPVIGAGTFANKSVAVSSTGAGEYFIRQGTARYIALRMQLLGESSDQACKAAMSEMKASGGDGGVICISADGYPSMVFCSAGMYRGYCSQSTKHIPVIGIFGDEKIAPGDIHIKL
ncbi:hypothetical protein IWW36_004504 [Coemansia brasiliensis]|uniref:beta-aspartyl-peptidase n=1 Tax=Coemansia brasiliensis TaxID=2650707 RepID=A0A9W8I3G4_9FUNG|nr:hypothetical protein IWW36_004504 [Coemansia brasiliensis]